MHSLILWGRKFYQLCVVVLGSVLVATTLGGCGGGGSGSQSAATTVTISGIASDGPINGGTITLSSLGGTPIGSATTASDGSFSIPVSSLLVANGYQLAATGGTMNGQPFSNTLSAIYSGSDNPSAANLTLLTTLVTSLAKEQSGSNLLAQRDNAITKLVKLGIILNSDEWSKLAPQSINTTDLNNAVNAIGLTNWLTQVTTDVQAGTLSAASMAGFPNAEGGIEALTVGAGTSSNAFQGHSDAVQVQLSAYPGSSNQYNYRLSGEPVWLTIDGNGLVTEAAPVGTPPGTYPYSITVTNTQTGKSRTLAASVYLMQTDVVATGAVGADGGTVKDPWNEYVLQVPAGVVTQDTTFSILRGTQADGQYAYTVASPSASKALLHLYVPNPVVGEAQLKTTSVQSQALLSASVRVQAQTPIGTWNTWLTFPPAQFLNITWPNPLYNTADAGLGVPSTIVYSNRMRNGLPPGTGIPFIPNVTTTDTEIPAELSSLCSLATYGQSCGSHDPVLLINGFVLPGTTPKQIRDSTYWNSLPEFLCNNKEDESPGTCDNYAVFEFDWPTNQRFEDAAADLAEAINTIYNVSGRKVHLIAHSFGGLLARTYLQGLAIGSKGQVVQYGGDVASLTMIDTPNSGIFPKAGEELGINFPDGQFPGAVGTLVKFCNAVGEITCDEAGVATPFAYSVGNIDLSGYLGILRGSPGVLVADLASQLKAKGLPVPTLSLIGLSISDDNGTLTYSDGDGVLSYAGQLLTPYLSCDQQANGACGNITVANAQAEIDDDPSQVGIGGSNTTAIEQHVLLFGDNVVPNELADPSTWPADVPKPTTLPFLGFQHTNTNWGGWAGLFAPLLNTGTEGVLAIGVTGKPYTQCYSQYGGLTHPTCTEILNWVGKYRDALTTTPSAPTTLSITVQSNTGSPILGATVMVGSNSATTNGSGQATLELNTDTIGGNTIAVAANGYRPTSISFTPKTPLPPTLSEAPIVLTPVNAAPSAGSLTGRITDASTGASLVGAGYRIVPGSGSYPIAKGTTDSGGSYQISGLPQGTYTLYVSASGYVTADQAVTISAGSSTAANVAMAQYTPPATDLPAPMPESPQNGAQGVSPTVAFTWGAVSGAVSYRLMIATSLADLPTDPGSASCANCIDVTPTTNSYSATTLQTGQTYYWEVKARPAASDTQYAYGDWSAINTLTTAVPSVTATLQLTANPASIDSGQSSDIQWVGSGVQSCTFPSLGAISESGQTVLSPAQTTTYTISCFDTKGNPVSASTTVTVTPSAPPPAPPATINLSATPTTILAGNYTTLSWSGANIKDCVASGDWSGDLAVPGSELVYPTATATYTINCADATAGTTDHPSSSTTVHVDPDPTVQIASATTPPIGTGQVFTITWSAANAASCAASSAPAGVWSGSQPTSGSQTFNESTAGQYTFNLTCDGADGSTATNSVTVNVIALENVTLTANPTVIQKGGSSTLTWSSQNVTSCSGTSTNGDWGGPVPLDGSQVLDPAASESFSINCTGSLGTVTDVANVSVTASLPTASITATPTSVATGQNFVLRWNSSNSNSCVASTSGSTPWSGDKGLAGQALINESTAGSVTFTYTCTGSAGTQPATASATVNVVAAAPVAVAKARPTIAAGYDDGMAVDAGGTLYAAGDNSYGQLGTGDLVNHSTWTPVLSGVATVCAGNNFALAAETDGTLWGAGENDVGQLGFGVNSNVSTWTQLPSLSGIVQVACGTGHSLALASDGTLYATGMNSSGQLGTGNGTTAWGFTPVLSGVAAVAAGGQFSLALKSDGTLWATGDDTYGELGLGGYPTNSWVEVLTGVTRIAAGYQHAFALKADGTLWATGANGLGQLGDGTATSRLFWTEVLSNVTRVAAGYDFSLAVKSDGTVWSAGDTSATGLAGGSGIGWQQVLSGMSDVVAPDSNGYSFALAPDGSLWAVGSNDSGQFGDGTNTGTSTWTEVMLGVAIPPTN